MKDNADTTRPAYWVAFGPHGPRALPPPGEGLKVFSYTMIGVVAAGLIFGASRMFARGSPSTMNKEWQEATNEYMRVSFLKDSMRRGKGLVWLSRRSKGPRTNAAFTNRKTRSSPSPSLEAGTITRARRPWSRAPQRSRSNFSSKYQFGDDWQCGMLAIPQPPITGAVLHTPHPYNGRFSCIDCRTRCERSRRERLVFYTSAQHLRLYKGAKNRRYIIS